MSSLTPLVGLDFSGATLTSHDDLPPGTGALGKPVWGPGELLRDLELRLGLSVPAGSESLRVLRWAARMNQVAARGRFYSKSFGIDPLGTAAAVLSLRDAMVEAGWDGGAIADGGRRVEAVVELEALQDPELLPGVADRVARVARELASFPVRLYEELTLGEPARHWSRVWQEVFLALERAGTRRSLSGEGASELGEQGEGDKLPLWGERMAPPESDLGKVQAALLRDGAAVEAVRLSGDGSFVLLEAETSMEAASATAALLAGLDARGAVVIRERDADDLDHALWVQGLGTAGVSSASRWRAMLQLLPLALELAFEPKDPYRVLELLTLPGGPFQGAVGRRMARALSRSPGVGGRAWQEAKERLAEPREGKLLEIAEWFEVRGADPVTGATKEELLGVVERVRGWLLGRVPSSPDDATLFAAIAACEGLQAMLAEEERARFDLVLVRQLLELVGVGARVPVLPELAGRVAHVSSPGALWVRRETVVWWSFTHDGEAPKLSPFRKAEGVALQRAGLRFPDAGERLQEQARSFRRGVFAAMRQLILVAPKHRAGRVLGPHALWDEMVARLRLDAEGRGRVVMGVRDLLEGRGREVALDVAVEGLSPLPLPGGHVEWNVSVEERPELAHASSSSLSSLFGCPLKWAFEYWAGLGSEGIGLPAMHLLSGTLGHRLIEELHARAAFELSVGELRTVAERDLSVLVEREGAVLLRPGKAHEHEQLVRQLVDAACAFSEVLRENELRVLSVEKGFEVPWQGASLRGRWDIVAEDTTGRRVVIDMKWGKKRYADMLAEGNALQLAAYGYALERERQSEQESGAKRDISAGYYSLKAQRLLALPGSGLSVADAVKGPPLRATWERVERSLPVVREQVERGRLCATGLRSSVSVLAWLGLDDAVHADYYDVPLEHECEYCGFDGLCGRRWEKLS